MAPGRACCWDSLPSDVVSHIADSFLATNDVDYYMDFRAVCRETRDWRCATDDPSNASDRRFHPRCWIVMDVEDYGDSRLLLNTATGRFLRRDMMARLLRGHHVAAVAAGGFLVLADKISPQAGVRVLNSLTGRSIRFRASLPTNVLVENVAAVLGSSPTLVLCSGSGKLYSADPESECFTMYTVRRNTPVRQAIANGVYDNLGMNSLTIPDDPRLITHDPGHGPFLVECAGETLAIIVRQHRVEVFSFKIDAADGNSSELIGPLKSIGGGAIFVDDCRCLCVDAGKFPTIDPDCIYYVDSQDFDHCICMYDMAKEKEERIIGIPAVTDHIRPFTIIQLLYCYTMEIQILTHGTACYV